MISPWYQGTHRWRKSTEEICSTRQACTEHWEGGSAGEWPSWCLLQLQVFIFWPVSPFPEHLTWTCEKNKFLSGKLAKISFMTDLFLEVKWNCSQNQWSSPPFYYPPRSWWISDDRGPLSYWSADMTSPVVFQITGKQRDMTLFSSSII